MHGNFHPPLPKSTIKSRFIGIIKPVIGVLFFIGMLVIGMFGFLIWIIVWILTGWYFYTWANELAQKFFEGQHADITNDKYIY